MENEVTQLVLAFRSELEGCHAFLDEARVPRVVGGRTLTLKERISVLVAADEDYIREVTSELSTLRRKVGR